MTVHKFPAFRRDRRLSIIAPESPGGDGRMVDPVRQEVVALAQTVVVKIGTNVLTEPDGTLDRGRVQSLADQVQRLRAGGRRVVLVSSGAIGAGVGELGLGKRP